MSDKTKQSQKSGDNSQNIQVAGNLVQGTTALYSIEEIAKKLLNTSFGELSESTKKQIESNQKTYFDVLSNNLAKINQQQEKINSVIESPDFAYTSKIAAIAASKSNSLELHKNLALLIVHRINSDNEDLKKIVYNEAIATIAKLTTDQLKIITLCFLLRYTTSEAIISLDTFNQHLNQQISPFLDFKNTVSQFEHVQYAGCGNISIGGWDYIEIIKSQYFHIFFKLVTKEEIEALEIDEELSSKLIDYRQEEDKFHIPFQQKTLQEFLENQGVEQSKKQQIINLYNSHMMNNNEIKEILKSNTDQGEKMLEILEKTLLKNMSLTSVGKAIAMTYFEQISGMPLNSDIWIN